jgi:thioredoxin 1
MTHSLPYEALHEQRVQMTENHHSTNDRDLDRDVLRAPIVLVKFTGAWCPPCNAVQPTLEAIERENPGVLVLSIDAENNPESTLRYGVRVLPTILAFHQGALRSRLVGNQRKSLLLTLLQPSDAP